MASTLIMLLLCTSGQAAKVHNFYTHYGSESGLTDSHIRNCCQDSFGRLWLATSGGVYYYNGVSFTPFSHPAYLENCSKMTFTVTEDNSGRIWIASSTEAGYYNPSSESFTIVTDVEGPVRDVDADTHGNVWLTSRSGIWRVRPESSRAEKVISNDLAFPNSSTLIKDEECLLVLSSDGAIYRFDINSSTYSLAIDPERTGQTYNYIADAGNGTVLVSTNSGEIHSIDLQSGTDQFIYKNNNAKEEISTTCLMTNGDEYWIGTSIGVVIINRITGETDDQTSLSTKPYSVAGNTVRCLLKDQSGNVWAGTYNGGLYCWTNYNSNFRRFTSNRLEHPLTGKAIRAICSDKPGSLWLGSEEGKLDHYDIASNKFKDFTSNIGLRFGTIITSIKYWHSTLWVTTYGDGLIQFDPRTGKVVKKYPGPTKRYFCIMPDNDSDLLIGTDTGVYRFNSLTEQFTFIDIVGKHSVLSLTKDKSGRVLAGTYEHGLGIWDPANGEVSILSAQDNQHGLKSNDINYLYCDSRGCVWVCTEGSGIERLKINDRGEITQADYFNQHTGMPSNNITGVVESFSDGTFWISTTNGLVALDPLHKTIKKVYLQADNVIGSHFIGGSCFLGEENTIYMGTSRGLFSFNAIKMPSQFESSIRITDISYSSLKEHEETVTKSAITSESIRLKREECDLLSISFSTMVYANPNMETFDCQLRKRGYSDNLTTAENSISYLGLKPGKYTFQVNVHGTETSDSITILITPKWYASILARIIYLLLALGATFAVVRHLISEKKRASEIENAKSQMQSLHERMDFLTNITHEIRTPVTMMSILMDKIPDSKEVVPVQEEDAKSLKMNMNRLLELCNQILDFRKMENEQLHLMMTDIDICELTRETADTITAVTQAEGIAYSVSIPDSPLVVTGDRKSIEGILINLLTNAVKYCSSRIDLCITSDGSEVTVRVNNDGDRIPEEESEMIFNAFYQIKKTGGYGTGLGLTYSRSLANMNNGKLYFDSRVPDLNSFVFQIPLAGNDLKITYTDTAEAAIDTDETANEEECLSGRPVILVVEDNADLKNLISDELSKDYDTLTASNGAEALEIVKTRRVDMVISDIMMPVMDGCQLCNAIKTDIDHSHILVVLLTAAIGVENHIRSLKAGADSYIEKPFKIDLLKANIHSLFKNIEIRNEQLAKSPLAQFKGTSSSTVELEFMEKLHSYIDEHISETEMSTERLAEAMSISRKTLISKIKANTGLSVNEYVRASRLKKAAEILAKKQYRINEVAYLVGYSTPSYFTKHFQKQFGVKPSDFVRSL